MKTVLQIEFSPSFLSERDVVLKRHGYHVISILGSSNARDVDVSATGMGVVVFGHVAPWLERESLIAYFRELLPGIPIVALLRTTDAPLSGAVFNCPADNPPLWERTFISALARTEHLQ